MKNVFLHIGANKTGSSAIQNYLDRNKSSLSKQGIHVLENTVDSAHYPLSYALGCGPKLQNVNAKAELKATAKEIQESKQNSIVISSEYFILADNPKDIVKLFSGCRVYVVLYLRRHDLWYESLYNQAVKTMPRIPWSSGINAYIDYVVAHSQQEFSYKNVVLRWSDAVGRDQMIVRPYERQFFPGRSIVKDFAGAIGNPVTIGNEALGVVNKSVPVQFLPMLELIKKTGTCNNKEIATILRWMLAQESDINVTLLSDANRKAIINDNMEEYRFLSSYFKMNREAFFADLTSHFGKREMERPSLKQAISLIKAMSASLRID